MSSLSSDISFHMTNFSLHIYILKLVISLKLNLVDRLSLFIPNHIYPFDQNINRGQYSYMQSQLRRYFREMQEI